MRFHPPTLTLFPATAWVGSLWAVGYLAVPILFRMQPDRQLAGMLAGHLFDLVTYLGLVCAALLLALRAASRCGPLWRDRSAQWIIVMLLLSLLIHFGIQPEMAALKAQALPQEVMASPLADRFKLLHGLSSIAYLLESLGGVLLLASLGKTLRGGV